MHNNQIKHVIITENPENISYKSENSIVITPEKYIADESANSIVRKDTSLRIINLCQDYSYLSKGYYCSLMAEARGQRCIPSVDNIITMNWTRLSKDLKEELNALLARHYKEKLDAEIAKTFLFIFGRSEEPKLEFLSRRIFDALRFPLLSVEIKYNGNSWVVGKIEAVSLKNLPIQKLPIFEQALEAYTGKAWNAAKKKVSEKFWLGILHNPKEIMPPSNKGALNNFLCIAKKKNVFAELITKEDISSLLEYDALLIRETTAIDHHTYRFAHKAENEGIPVIDDTASIVRCSNKVFLYETMVAKNINVPKTWLVDSKAMKKMIQDNPEETFILKVPDGSFSKGVVKICSSAEDRHAAQNLFKRSNLLLMQEFMPSDYDWRIGVLGGEPLFACRYFMADGHWQIYNHNAKTKSKKSGNHETVALPEVPNAVIQTAIKATKPMGNGLYGVDLKENDQGVFVIEVNDNPNIDKGIEDQIEGNEIYARIIDHLGALVEA
ncbi:MAG: RimK family protein [Alphaproteobacteria bacterium]|nr:RimK family protein [Alphaproteobacteria bacterium]